MRNLIINSASDELSELELKRQTEEFSSSSFSTNSSSGKTCTNVNCKAPSSGHVFKNCRGKGGGSEQTCSYCRANDYGHTEAVCFRKKKNNVHNKGGKKGGKGGKGKGGKSAGAGPPVDPKFKKPCTYGKRLKNMPNNF